MIGGCIRLRGYLHLQLQLHLHLHLHLNLNLNPYPYPCPYLNLHVNLNMNLHMNRSLNMHISSSSSIQDHRSWLEQQSTSTVQRCHLSQITNLNTFSLLMVQNCPSLWLGSRLRMLLLGGLPLLEKAQEVDWQLRNFKRKLINVGGGILKLWVLSGMFLSRYQSNQD